MISNLRKAVQELADTWEAGLNPLPAFGERLREALAANPEPEMIRTVREVQALPVGTILLSDKTTHRWVWAGMDKAPVVHGSGGGYSFVVDFIEHEAPFRVLREGWVQA